MVAALSQNQILGIDFSEKFGIVVDAKSSSWWFLKANLYEIYFQDGNTESVRKAQFSAEQLLRFEKTLSLTRQPQEKASFIKAFRSGRNTISLYLLSSNFNSSATGFKEYFIFFTPSGRRDET